MQICIRSIKQQIGLGAFGVGCTIILYWSVPCTERLMTYMYHSFTCELKWIGRALRFVSLCNVYIVSAHLHLLKLSTVVMNHVAHCWVPVPCLVLYVVVPALSELRSCAQACVMHYILLPMCAFHPSTHARMYSPAFETVWSIATSATISVCVIC